MDLRDARASKKQFYSPDIESPGMARCQRCFPVVWERLFREATARPSSKSAGGGSPLSQIYRS